MSMWREGEGNEERVGAGRQKLEKEREEETHSPFYGESGIPAYCQVTLG